MIDPASVLGTFDFASDNINDFPEDLDGQRQYHRPTGSGRHRQRRQLADVVVPQGVSTDVAGLLTNGNLMLDSQTQPRLTGGHRLSNRDPTRLPEPACIDARVPIEFDFNCECSYMFRSVDCRRFGL